MARRSGRSTLQGMSDEFDVLVIGAGIAGVSAAAELANSMRVALVDMEAQPGYHATGRSAAFFAPSYGNAVVRGITQSCEDFYRSPHRDFTEVPLLRPRDALFIARADQLSVLADMAQEDPLLLPVTAAEACREVSILDSDYVSAALRDGQGGDLDVDAILQAYLRLFKRRGGELHCRWRVDNLAYDNGLWCLRCGDEKFSAPTVVNAAGAWAGVIGERAGLSDLGLQPLKRTASLLALSKQSPAVEASDIESWPLVVDVEELFYFKPEAGMLLVSPADESPSEPCDAQADEMDVAIAMAKLEHATKLEVRRVEHSWSGLRTFAPDRQFIAGFDPRSKGFFWFAGQGGYGVQSAPGMAKLCDHLIAGSSLAAPFDRVLTFIDDVAPSRLL